MQNAGVRRTSILALQSLYEVDGNIPSLGLFTERFYTRMIQLADDIDVSVAVSAIGLIKQLLRCVFRQDIFFVLILFSAVYRACLIILLALKGGRKQST